ncbi:MAG: NfeD family protein [Planctomycetaceae bacterium]
MSLVQVIGRLAKWAVLYMIGATTTFADDAANQPADSVGAESPAVVSAMKGPAKVGRFLTLTQPLGESSLQSVRRTAIELADEARRQGAEGTLIIGLPSGTCDFTHAYAIGDFLVSESIAGLRTVAWVEGDSTGPASLIAIACREVILHPNSRLGDIGKGETLSPERLEIALQLTRRSGNPHANEAIARAISDVNAVLLKVEWMADGVKQSRMVSAAERDQLKTSGLSLASELAVKEKGAIASFSGVQATQLEVLSTRLADSRRSVVELLDLPIETLREKSGTKGASVVRIIPIEGMIDESKRAMWSRHIQTALNDEADIIIFEIDSGGGYQYDSEELAKEIANLENYGVRTVAYIPKMAYSGAALIAMGCDEIYLHPTAHLGDIGQIVMNPAEGIINFAPAKFLSPLLVTLKDLADQKHRPAALAMSMADKNLPVYEVRHAESGSLWYMDEDEILAANGQWIKGGVVPETKDERFLTVNGVRAHELLLSGPNVSSLTELKSLLNLSEDVDVRTLQHTWVDNMALILNHWFFSGLLIVLALICLFIELHITSGFFGAGSAVFFGLFFWTKVLGGTAGTLEIVLFLIGLVCLLLELFVTPGFGVLGVSGLLLILASLFMAGQTFGNMEPGRDLSRALETGFTLLGAFGAVIVMSLLMSRFLPSIPLLNSIILAPPSTPGDGDNTPRLRRELTDSEQALLGQSGVAVTTLRPAGKAMIGSKLVDVVSRGGYIDEGTPIEITEVVGSRIVVSAREA